MFDIREFKFASSALVICILAACGGGGSGGGSSGSGSSGSSSGSSGSSPGSSASGTWSTPQKLDTGTQVKLAAVPGGTTFHAVWWHNPSTQVLAVATSVATSQYDDVNGWSPVATINTFAQTAATDPPNLLNLRPSFLAFDAQGNGVAVGMVTGQVADTSVGPTYTYWAEEIGSVQYTAGQGWGAIQQVAMTPFGGVVASQGMVPGYDYEALLGLTVSPAGNITTMVNSWFLYATPHGGVNSQATCPNSSYLWYDRNQVMTMYDATGIAGAGLLSIGAADPTLPGATNQAFMADRQNCEIGDIRMQAYPDQYSLIMASATSPNGQWRALSYHESESSTTGVAPANSYETLAPATFSVKARVSNGATNSETTLYTSATNPQGAFVRDSMLQTNSPGIAVAQDGTTLVTWSAPIPSSNSGSIYAIVYTPGQGWSSKQLLANFTNSGTSPIAEIDANGNGMLIFAFDGKSQYVLFDGKTRTLSTPVTFGASAPSNVWKILPDAKGNVWLMDCPAYTNFSVRRFDAASSTWSTASITQNTDGCGYNDMALDGNGNPLAIWVSSGTIYASRFQ